MKKPKLLFTLFIAIVSMFGAVAIACGKEDGTPSVKEGPETGVYYFDAVGGDEYLLSLYGGNQTTLVMDNSIAYGTYSTKQSEITLDYTSKSVGKLNGVISDDNNVITVSYNDVDMRFLRRETYTVEFNSNDGSAVESVPVINGKTLAKPADPTRDGYTFIGWYTDENFKTPFMFGTQPISSDMTLYAQWGVKVFGQNEYTIKFDVGDYDVENSIASKQTVGGKLYDLETPVCEGYDFKGWWYSMSGKADELTSRVTSDTVLKESTTLYAVWQAKNTDNKLNSPAVDVSEKLISWDAVEGADAYKVEISGPSGFNPVSPAPTAATSMTVSLNVTGEYTIRVTAISPSSNDYNSEPTVRYYRQNALNRVSLFTVVEPSTLLFNEVANAEKYLIEIDCGDKEHNHDNNSDHSPIDNGTSTNYNFANCAMQDGGIKFTVTAVADGYMSSVSETYVYNKMLDKIEELNYDEATQTVSWTPIENATNYIVSVKCGNSAHAHSNIDNGSKTSYCLKECQMPAEGGIVINVYPRTRGYNSPEPTNLTCEKSVPATPGQIKIKDNMLRWAAVAGENVKYTVEVGGVEYSDLTANEFDLSTIEDIWDDANIGSDYVIRVKAVDGEASSLWSDGVDARYYALYSSITYNRNTVSWRHVIGVDGYQVRVNENNSTLITVNDGSNYAKVSLLRSGVNKIEVRYIDGDKVGEWASVNVTAYAINFDTRGGTVTGGGSLASLYYAIGDEISLPNSDAVTLAGYTLDGWYNAPGGANGNGARYDYDVFTGSGDVMLYANWKGNSYKVTLNYNDGGSGVTEVYVQYGHAYKLPLPKEITNPSNVFGGWCSNATGDGRMLTDAYGVSTSAWTYLGDRTVYVRWVAALDYEKVQGGSAGYYYMVKPGRGSSVVRTITVPSEYKGENDPVAYPVTQVSAETFRGYYYPNLEIINLPATIETISLEAFKYPPASLREINVYDVDGINDPKYWSDDEGILYYNNISSVDVWFCPPGKTGSADGDGKLTISNKATNIAENAFYDSQLIELTIPASVTLVSAKAFVSSDIKTVIFASSSNSEDKLRIMAGAFDSMSSLTSIDLPSHKVVFVDGYGDPIEDVNIYSDILYINSSIPSKLDSINVANGNPDYKSVDGLLCKNDTNTTLIYVPKTRAGDENGIFTIPQGIYAIGSYAFSACRNINEVVIPADVVLIEENAFSGYKFTSYGAVTGAATTTTARPCSATKITFAGNASSPLEIGKNAFGHIGSDLACSIGLIVFEEGCFVEVIGEYAFARTVITEVTLPKSVKEVKEGAFAYCPSLAEIKYESEENGVDLSFGEKVFMECNTLGTLKDESDHYKPVDFPKFVVEIGSGIFDGCKNLTAVTVAEDNQFFVAIQGVLFGYKVKLNEDGSFDLDANGKKQPYLNEDGEQEMDTILYYPAGKTDGFVVPETITKLGGGLFRDNKEIPSIEIHANVVEIGDNVFRGCTNLSEVTLVDGSKPLKIGDNMFNGCTSLEEIVLPSRISEIKNGMFNGCSSLKTVEIKNANITRIGDEAFNGCKLLNCVSITGITPVDEKGNEIEDNYVCIPATVSYIGTLAFKDCKALQAVYFAATQNEEVSTVAEEDEDDNESFIALTIEASAFRACSNLGYINLPTRLTKIGNYAFETCTSLSSVAIPYTVKSIGLAAFASCSNLSTLTFDDAPENVTREDLTLLDGGESTGVFAYCRQLNRVSFPSGLTKVPDYCFYNCTGLEYVYIPNTISNGAWNGSLQTAIGTYAFYDCTQLSEVEFQPGEQTGNDNSYFGVALGLYAFVGCDSLEKITLPSSLRDATDQNGNPVSAIGKLGSSIGQAFYYSSLKYSPIEIEMESEGTYYMMHDGALYKKTITDGKSEISLVWYPFYVTGTVEISMRATSIAAMSFYSSNYNYNRLTEITFEEYNEENKGNVDIDALPDLVIGDNSNAALNCYNAAIQNTGITSIKFPARLVEICHQSMSKNRQLTSVTFEDNSRLDRIGIYAFYQCERLESFEIPGRLRTIDNYAFMECKAFDTISFKQDTQYKRDADGNIVKDEDGKILYVTEDDEEGNAVKVVTYGLLEIKEQAFAKTAFTSIVLPSSVTTLGNAVFSGCSKLAEITLSKNIQSFAGAFSNCKATIKMPDDSVNFKTYYDDGIVYSADGKTLTYCPPAFTPVTVAVDPITGQEVTIEGEYRIPYGVTEIADGAFASNKFIKKIVIPNTVEKIGSKAFNCCFALEEIEFEQDDVIHYGKDTEPEKNADKKHYSFVAGADGENDKYVEDENGEYIELPRASSLVIGKTTSSSQSSFTDSYADKDSLAFGYCDSLKSVNFPRRTSRLGRFSFYKCYSLEEVTFADGCEMQVLESHMFRDCAKLHTVKLPDDLKYLGMYYAATADATSGNANPSTSSFTSGYVFYGCKELTNIELPDTLTHIYAYAFAGSGLTSITIPASTYVLGINAFDGCTDLKSVEFESGSPIETLNVAKTCNVNGATITAAYTNNTSGGSYFNQCTALETVTLPAGLKYINNSAFEGCTNLTVINTWNASNQAVAGLPNALVSIGNSAFKNTNLGGEVEETVNGKVVTTTPCAKLEIPGGVTTIGTSAFAGTSVKVITFNKATVSNSVLTLTYGSATAPGAFALATMLEKVDFNGRSLTTLTYSASTMNNINARYGITAYAFYGCEKLVSVLNLPDNTVAIGTFAFAGCSSLKNISIVGDNIADDEDAADASSGNASEEENEIKTLVHIPSGVVSLGVAAFYGSGIENVLFAKNASQVIRLTGTTTVANGVFEDCIYLSSVDFNGRSVANTATGSVTSASYANILGSRVFYNAGTASNEEDESNEEAEPRTFVVNFPANLVQIAASCFENSGLTSLEIPASVTTIANTAFWHTTKLGALTFESRSSALTIANGTNTSNGAFNGSGLSSIVFPSTGLTNTGNYTFYGCSNLTTIDFGGVTTIGTYAFANSGLKNLSIGNGVLSIGESAFRNCSELLTVALKDKNGNSVLNSIGNDAFTDCSQLASVEIPASVTSLGGLSAFASCGNLTSLTVEEGNENFIAVNDAVYSADKSILYCYATGKTGEFVLPGETSEIKQGAFFGSKINKFTVNRTNDNDLTIPQYTFQNSANLAEINISCKVFIGDYAFAYCDNLTVKDKIAFGEGTEFGAYVFYGCENLASISIPKNAKVQLTTFVGCDNLEKNNINTGDGVSYEYNGFVVDNSGAVVITGTSIANNAYKDSTAITSVKISEGVTSIGNSAFENCENLTSITLPSTLETIGNKAFAYTGIKNITIPASVTFIDYGAFMGSAVETITFVANTSAIKLTATSTSTKGYTGSLAKAENLHTVDFNGRPITAADSATVAGTANTLGQYMFVDDKALSTVNNLSTALTKIDSYAFKNTKISSLSFIPASVTALGNYVFDGAELKNITIPAGWTSIGTYTFANNARLESVTWPSSYNTIPAHTFYNCGNLTQFTIPANVTEIGEGAFKQSGLTGITIPATVATIGKAAFAGSKIVDMEFEAGEDLLTITAGGGIDDISKAGAFGMIETLQTVDFKGRALTTIAAYTFAQSSLSTVQNLPDISTIGNYAFYGTNLTEFTVPDSVNGSSGIGSYAFAECKQLKKITLPSAVNNSTGTTVFAYMSSNAFTNSAIESITIPDGVTTIQTSVFMGCTELKSVELPSGLVNIYTSAFEGCVKLEYIVLPEEVKEIKKRAFAGCIALDIVVNEFLTSNKLETTDVFEGLPSTSNIYVVGAIARPDLWVYGWSGDATVVWDYDMSGDSEETDA